MNRLAYFAALYAGSAIFLKASGFALSLWMARTLPIEEYGIWGLIIALQTGLTTFGSVGIVEAVVGLLRHHPSPEERGKLFAAANKTFLLTVASSLGGATLLSLLFLRSDGIGLLALCGALVSGVLLSFATLQAQIVRLDERHLASLGFSFWVPFAGVAGSVVCFALEPSVESFFIGSAIGLALAIAALRAKTGFYNVGLDQDRRWTQIGQRLVPYVAVAFFGWLSGYGNNFVVNALFQPTEVARFTFALSIGAVIQLVATALNQVWSPHFFQITQVQPVDLVEQHNRRFFSFQSIVLGVLSAACLSLLPPVLKALGGNLTSYDSMGLELFFVLAAYVLLSPWSHCHNYFLAYDKGSSVMRIVLTTSTIGIMLWILSMWLLGPLGIYVGFFVQMAVRSFGIVYVAKGIWPLQIGWASVATGLLIALGGLLVVQS